jgi:glutamyl-tRNA reductase
VELALHRVTQSLLHTPTLRARELARTGDSAGYLQALHTLFGIDITDPEISGHSPTVRLTS